MRDSLKFALRALATIAVLPRIASFRLWAPVIGRDRALEGSTQRLARIPGLRGQYLRRAFLRYSGVDCHPSATICYGTTFSKCGAVIEANVYVGPGCHIGLVHLERDVLLAAGVHVPSGPHVHGTAETDVPIRDQPGTTKCIRVGAGTWVGSASVIMADVGRDCVIGAGSVVTRPVPAGTVAAGVPARVVRARAEPAISFPAR